MDVFVCVHMCLCVHRCLCVCTGVCVCAQVFVCVHMCCAVAHVWRSEVSIQESVLSFHHERHREGLRSAGSFIHWATQGQFTSLSQIHTPIYSLSLPILQESKPFKSIYCLSYALMLRFWGPLKFWWAAVTKVALSGERIVQLQSCSNTKCCVKTLTIGKWTEVNSRSVVIFNSVYMCVPVCIKVPRAEGALAVLIDQSRPYSLETGSLRAWMVASKPCGS